MNTRKKEMQRSEHKQRHEEEEKLLKRIKIEEELRRVERRNVEYSVVGYKVAVTFIIIFGMCKNEGI
jgi:hypothetical protein